MVNSQAAEAVYLMPKETYTITRRRRNSDPQGPIEYVAHLSQLLPDVIEDNSPMKGTSSFATANLTIDSFLVILARAGRIYRQIENAGHPNFVYLGDVATILRGESNKLKLSLLDDYILDAESVPGSFVCNVWCDNTMEHDVS